MGYWESLEKIAMWNRFRHALFASAALLLMKALTPTTIAAENSGSPFGVPLPGAPRFDAVLIERLAAKWDSRDPQYKPRTRHLRPDGLPQYTKPTVSGIEPLSSPARA
jgi:hypothetical protein